MASTMELIYLMRSDAGVPREREPARCGTSKKKTINTDGCEKNLTKTQYICEEYIKDLVSSCEW